MKRRDGAPVGMELDATIAESEGRRRAMAVVHINANKRINKAGRGSQ